MGVRGAPSHEEHPQHASLQKEETRQRFEACTVSTRGSCASRWLYLLRNRASISPHRAPCFGRVVLVHETACVCAGGCRRCVPPSSSETPSKPVISRICRRSPHDALRREQGQRRIREIVRLRRRAFRVPVPAPQSTMAKMQIVSRQAGDFQQVNANATRKTRHSGPS